MEVPLTAIVKMVRTVSTFAAGLLLTAFVPISPAGATEFTYRVLLGHTREPPSAGTVLGLSVSPDQTTLASGSRDDTVRLWDLATGAPKQVLAGHTDDIYWVSHSPDGNLLASGAADSRVLIWDLTTSPSQVVHTLDHPEIIRCAVFSPDGQTAASVGSDRIVRLWDTATWQLRAMWEGHTSIIKGLVFSPNGSLLISAGGGVIRVWNAQTGDPLGTFDASARGYESLAISPDGQTLAAGNMDGEVQILDLASRQLLRTLPTMSTSNNDVDCLAFRADGKVLASGSKDAKIRIYETKTWRLLHNIPYPSYIGGRGPESMVFTQDGRILATGASDGEVKLWDVSALLDSSVEDWTLYEKQLSLRPELLVMLPRLENPAAKR